MRVTPRSGRDVPQCIKAGRHTFAEQMRFDETTCDDEGLLFLML